MNENIELGESGELTEEEKNEEIEDFIEESIEENNHEKDVNKKLTICAILLVILVIFLAFFGFAFAPSGDILGNGDKTITLSIVLPHDTINYTIATDVNTLEEILMQHNLAELTHLGSGSIINSIAGYTLKKDVEWFDIYINDQIVYIRTSQVIINDGDSYKIVIV